jgi:N6-adenosine-specific RNA methylase IME4
MKLEAITHDFFQFRPVGGFDLIMADPPWAFSTWSKRGQKKSASQHYTTQKIEWIARLPVQILASENCLLWMWATNPMLPEALHVLRAWGFRFKTAGTWCKRTRSGGEAFGTGYLLRGANEPFLIGTIGKPKVTRSTRSAVITEESEGTVSDDLKWPASTITIDAIREAHSAKPDEAYEAAESLMPGAQRLELFSRRSREGWKVWGDEAGKFDVPK